MEKFIERMIELRQAKGLTQSDVAKALSVSLQTYKRWENGSFPIYGFKKVIRIADFYNVSVDYIAGRSN